MSQPPWLQSSLTSSHLSHVVRVLNTREVVRESAGIVQNTPHLHGRIDFSRTSQISPDIKEFYSKTAGQHPLHKNKNRYRFLEPYDRTRVLVPIPGPSDHNIVGSVGDRESKDVIEHRYINANWVRESAGGKWWIAGQAPLPQTIHAFLTLVMCPVAPTISPMLIPSLPSPKRVHTIVQLTMHVENGQQRTHPYFPSDVRHDMTINPEHGRNAPPIHVRVESEERIDDAKCILTDLRLRWGGTQEGGGSSGRTQEWQVTHLLYTAWPDFGVPHENTSILHFARLVERVNNRSLLHSSNDINASPPVLVHCSAGVGRTGSFITFCSILRSYSLLSLPCSPSMVPSLAAHLPLSPLGHLPPRLKDDLVAQEVDSLREQRQAMVQKEEQIVWVYEALHDAFEGK